MVDFQLQIDRTCNENWKLQDTTKPYNETTSQGNEKNDKRAWDIWTCLHWWATSWGGHQISTKELWTYMVVNLTHDKSVKTFDDIVCHLELEVKRIIVARPNEQAHVVESSSCENFRL